MVYLDIQSKLALSIYIKIYIYQFRTEFYKKLYLVSISVTEVTVSLKSGLFIPKARTRRIIDTYFGCLAMQTGNKRLANHR